MIAHPPTVPTRPDPNLATLLAMTPLRVLIVEDDPDIAAILVENLTLAGYKVTLARDGMEGLAQARTLRPDLLILDLMLPVISGEEVCRRLRADATLRGTQILMLTAKGEEADEIIGLSLGADDYVTKPFSIRVLLERLRALRRRADVPPGEAEPEDSVTAQGITVDRVRHRVTFAGATVPLTRSEFNLLDTLIARPGRVFQRSELIDSALGTDTMVLERTIDVHIRALRRKLGAAADVIETVRGVGYRFRDQPRDAAADADE